jgi:cytochrome b subunit of formate dehydrogenase
MMSKETKTYLRFDVARRIEHLLMILSFTTLGLTGLIQKFALNDISLWFVKVLGGIESVRIIHRVAATVFILEGIYHLILLGYILYVKRKEATMMPGIKDATDALQVFLYNLGLGKKYPKMPRYNFTEKAEYLAMVWGFVLMGLTGFMLWNPILTAKLLPGEFIPAAKAAHGAEAVLAVLAIILWHFYNVHIKHWNWSMIKGHLTRHEMEEEHGQELEKIESGEVYVPPPPSVYKKRMAIFAPLSAVLSIALIAGLIFFITFEESAITTVPPVYADVEVFVPQTPTPMPTQVPTPTPDPAMANTWDGGINTIFEQQCGLCHGNNGGLSIETYAGVIQGGESGPMIIPGSPEASSVLTIADPANNHPGQFTEEQLEKIRIWISNGAPK